MGESAVLLDLPELKKSNSSLVLSLVPDSPLSQVSSRVSAVLLVLPEEENNKTCSSDPSLVPDSPLSQVSSTVLVVSLTPLKAENRKWAGVTSSVQVLVPLLVSLTVLLTLLVLP